VVDRLAGVLEVEPEQVVVALEVEPAERALARGAGDERDEPLAAAALRAPDEEDAGVR